MPILFPFAVHVQQSKKQQVSNCCVLQNKSIMKNDEKKYDENENMDADIQNRYHTGINSKKSCPAVNQTTRSSMRSEATL